MKILDRRTIEKVGGGGGGGERECIVRSRGRHYGKRRFVFRVTSQGKREREMIVSSSMSCFGQH